LSDNPTDFGIVSDINIKHPQQSTNLYHNFNMATDSSDNSVERNRQADDDDPSAPSNHRYGQFKDILYDTDDGPSPATRATTSHRRGQLKDPFDDVEDDTESGPTIVTPAKPRTPSHRRGKLKDPFDDVEDDTESGPTIVTFRVRVRGKERAGAYSEWMDGGWKQTNWAKKE
jgi:hypothetical protein